MLVCSMPVDVVSKNPVASICWHPGEQDMCRRISMLISLAIDVWATGAILVQYCINAANLPQNPFLLKHNKTHGNMIDPPAWMCSIE